MSGGPITKNTATSAITASDQSALAVGAPMPAPLQRITAKASCIA